MALERKREAGRCIGRHGDEDFFRERSGRGGERVHRKSPVQRGSALQRNQKGRKRLPKERGVEKEFLIEGRWWKNHYILK